MSRGRQALPISRSQLRKLLRRYKIGTDEIGYQAVHEPQLWPDAASDRVVAANAIRPRHLSAEVRREIHSGYHLRVGIPAQTWDGYLTFDSSAVRSSGWGGNDPLGGDATRFTAPRTGYTTFVLEAVPLGDPPGAGAEATITVEVNGETRWARTGKVRDSGIPSLYVEVGDLVAGDHLKLHSDTALEVQAGGEAITQLVNRAASEAAPAVEFDLLHLDASELSAGDLASWDDLSGAGNHVSQDTASNQPQVVDGVLNGLPVVRFDGIDERLIRDTIATTSGLPVTMFVVARSTATTFPNIREMVSCDPDGSSDRSCEVAIDTDGHFVAGSASGTNLQGPTADTDWHVIEAVFDGADSLIAVDGGTPAEGDAGGGTFDGVLHVGKRFDDGHEGDIAEIGAVSRRLTATERAAKRAELQDKWGLS